ncbi:Uncharacterised protein [Myroides odoratus]|nr:hypothetical protein Myrod_0691 [Myroides odoratus DSM 2801]EKB02680.1 hypothetical protein HMPREF9716_03709 [Myroides odoratus CIP 103059]STZ28790.1 Uncharacterised protein [Myroides odoratus]
MKKWLYLIIVVTFIILVNHFLYCKIYDLYMFDFSRVEVLKSIIFSIIFSVTLGIFIFKKYLFKKN